MDLFLVFPTAELAFGTLGSVQTKSSRLHELGLLLLLLSDFGATWLLAFQFLLRDRFVALMYSASVGMFVVLFRINPNLQALRLKLLDELL